MEHLLPNREDMHTLSVYVANQPGVLARIAQVFARRGYNIDSLVVSSSRDGKFSRMTITAKGNPEGLDQIIAQVNKLVDVIRCVDHTGENAVVRELALMKVAANTPTTAMNAVRSPLLATDCPSCRVLMRSS